MKNVLSALIVLFLFTGIKAQDCFAPPSNSTLYTTTDPSYSIPAVSGFVTQSSNFNGQWSVTASNGANINFTDNDGRRSSFEITGSGTVTVQNILTDITTSASTTCSQMFDVSPYISAVAPNPTITNPCPLNVVLVLDESESMAPPIFANSLVSAVSDLATALSQSGSSLALVEFESTARRISLNGSDGLQVVDQALITAIDNYLLNDYNPMEDQSNLIGGTNWEDALMTANQVSGADLVLMLTDGRPTFYNTPMGVSGVAGEGLLFDLTALKKAQDAANVVKSSGKHILVAGLNFPAQIQTIIDISGTNEFVLGQNTSALLSADYTLIPPSSLGSLFSTIGTFCLPVTVPTIGEWGLIILSLLLLILSVLVFKTKPDMHTVPPTRH